MYDLVLYIIISYGNFEYYSCFLFWLLYIEEGKFYIENNCLIYRIKILFDYELILNLYLI